jgi:hypothetical protein
MFLKIVQIKLARQEGICPEPWEFEEDMKAVDKLMPLVKASMAAATPTTKPLAESSRRRVNSEFLTPEMPVEKRKKGSSEDENQFWHSAEPQQQSDRGGQLLPARAGQHQRPLPANLRPPLPSSELHFDVSLQPEESISGGYTIASSTSSSVASSDAESVVSIDSLLKHTHRAPPSK